MLRCDVILFDFLWLFHRVLGQERCDSIRKKPGKVGRSMSGLGPDGVMGALAVGVGIHSPLDTTWCTAPSYYVACAARNTSTRSSKRWPHAHACAQCACTCAPARDAFYGSYATSCPTTASRTTGPTTTTSAGNGGSSFTKWKQITCQTAAVIANKSQILSLGKGQRQRQG